MKVKSQTVDCLHLDPGYALLSVQNILTCFEYFRLLDIHYNASINDCQFWMFAKSVTDLSRNQSDTLFHLLDVDHSGEMDFEEFYLVFCIMIACKDKYEKEFIYRHSSSIFKLIDADASGLVSKSEFAQMGVLFNFDSYSISNIFNEFDISGDKNLDFTEFRLFTMACIDEQRSAEALHKVEAYSSYQKRLMTTLRPTLMRYVRTNKLPIPLKVGRLVNGVRLPYIDERRRWRTWWDPSYFIFSLKQSCAKFGQALTTYWKFMTLPFITFYKKIIRSCRKCCEKTRFSAVAQRRRDKKAKRNLFSYKYYYRNTRAGHFKSRRKSGQSSYGGLSKMSPSQTLVETTMSIGRNKIGELSSREMGNE